MDLSQWHTACWGIDNQVHDVSMFHRMIKNEEWNGKRAKVSALTHIVQVQMRLIEELLFEMGDIERQERERTKE